jgi:hypothetical protein
MSIEEHWEHDQTPDKLISSSIFSTRMDFAIIAIDYNKFSLYSELQKDRNLSMYSVFHLY